MPKKYKMSQFVTMASKIWYFLQIHEQKCDATHIQYSFMCLALKESYSVKKIKCEFILFDYWLYTFNNSKSNWSKIYEL